MTDHTTLDTPAASTPQTQATDAHNAALPNLATTATALAGAAVLSACGGGDTEPSVTVDGKGDRAQAAGLMTWGTPDDVGAWRFLQQASMGPIPSPAPTNPPTTPPPNSIDGVKSLGYANWLNDQMTNYPYSNQVLNKAPAPGTYAAMYFNGRGGTPDNELTPKSPVPSAAPYGTITDKDADNEWHRHVTAFSWMQPYERQDQLRQRVVYALSQFLVVSLRHEILGFNPMMVAGYMDMLSANAFGNFRVLIEEVCKSPAMGYYLSHASNLPPEFDGGALKRIPDQNFARELLQLFTIGLTKLNMDGTEVLVNGAPVPTTTTSDIVVLSNVFTGWSLDRSASLGFSPLNMHRLRSDQTATPDKWSFQERDELYDTSENGFDLDKRLYYFGSRPRYRRSLRYIVPMAPFADFTQTRVHEITGVVEDLGKLTTHSTQALLASQLGVAPNKVTFLGAPFTLGANPQASLTLALDRIFAHPNLAPFIAKQMIQHLVTSNPSRTYVQNVATAFKNKNWDMKELLRAILLDSEARLAVNASASTFGRLKEPYLRVLQMLRAFGVNTLLYPAETIYMANENPSLNLNHQYMWAPSVFNDFSPRYVHTGGKMAAKGLVVPQLQIATESAVVAYVNAVHDILDRGLGQEKRLDVDATGGGTSALALKTIIDATPTMQPLDILNLINARLFGNTMSNELKSLVLSAATGTSPTPGTLLQRIKAAIFLAVVSTEYMVQR